MGREVPKIGRTAHAVQADRGDPAPVSFLAALLLVLSLVLVAAMVFGVAGPLTAAARDR